MVGVLAAEGRLCIPIALANVLYAIFVFVSEATPRSQRQNIGRLLHVEEHGKPVVIHFLPPMNDVLVPVSPFSNDNVEVVVAFVVGVRQLTHLAICVSSVMKVELAVSSALLPVHVECRNCDWIGLPLHP